MYKRQLLGGDLDPLVQQINADALDYAFVTHVSSMQFSGMCSETVLSDRMVIVTNPSHPFPRKDSISLKELDGMPMIAFEKQSCPITFDFHKQLFKSHGLRYNICLLYTSIAPMEEILFKAAARAQKETGCAIITHTQKGTMGPEQAELLISCGADPNKIAIGHMCGSTDIDYFERVLKQGV